MQKVIFRNAGPNREQGAESKSLLLSYDLILIPVPLIHSRESKEKINMLVKTAQRASKINRPDAFPTRAAPKRHRKG